MKHPTHIKQKQIKSKKKQAITYANLQLTANLVDMSKETFLAQSSLGYKAVCGLFPLCGVGVKKRHPTLEEIKDDTRVKDLGKFDTINMFNIDLEEEHAITDWFDESIDAGRFLSRNNWIRLTFDRRLHELTLSMLCFALNINSYTSVALQDYLTDHQIEWDNVND